MTCSHCGAEVPDDQFCTRCGAHRSLGSMRLYHFALRPGEHVATPNVLSTLLPRLSHEHVHRFRWALTGGVVLIALLVATGLVIPAVWVAIVLVPVLYLAYLRGVDVYADAPLPVLAGTVLAGAAVGVAVTVAADSIGKGRGAGSVILLLVGVAIVSELLKPAIPFLLLRTRFPSAIDGLVFGVAAGVGYAVAQAVVNLSGGLGGLSLRADPASWAFTLVSVGLLIPLVHGSCSGLVATSLWRPAGGRDAALRAAAIPLAIVADIGFTAGSEVLDDARLSPLFVLLWQAAVVAAVLVAVRVLIHAAVLDEGAALGLREVRCGHCGRIVEAAGFCPHCGVAIDAGSAVARPAIVS